MDSSSTSLAATGAAGSLPSTAAVGAPSPARVVTSPGGSSAASGLAASKEAARTMQTRYDARNPGALAELKARDITIRPFAESIMTAARDASEQLLSDAAAGDAAYGKLLNHWRKFRDESFGWFGSAELAYANFAFPGR